MVRIFVSTKVKSAEGDYFSFVVGKKEVWYLAREPNKRENLSPDRMAIL